MNRLLIGVVLGAASGGALGAPPIVMDGRFDDWRGTPYLPVDAPNDATGAFDVCRVSAASRGTVVFVRFNTGRTVTLQSGPEEQGTLILDVEIDAGRRLSIDLRGRALWVDGNTEQPVGHSDFGLVTAPTHSSEEFELRFDLAPLGASVGQRITLGFRGSDEIETPVRLTLGGEPIPAERGGIGRAPGTDLRIASYNIKHGGLTDPTRREAVARLLKATDADVYCLQEQWRTPLDEITRAFDEAFGVPPGTWSATNAGGAVVATRLDADFPATTLERVGLATFRPESGPPMVIASVHFKCCGHDGSMEDRTRIEEVRSLEYALSSHAGKDGLVLVAGDWNLVGSALPLAVLTREDGRALGRLWPRHLDGVETHTWRDAGQTFTPGILDLVLHSGALEPLNAFVLDTADIGPDRLESTGLHAEDSEASDHLMIVADFALPD